MSDVYRNLRADLYAFIVPILKKHLEHTQPERSETEDMFRRDINALLNHLEQGGTINLTAATKSSPVTFYICSPQAQCAKVPNEKPSNGEQHRVSFGSGIRIIETPPQEPDMAEVRFAE